MKIWHVITTIEIGGAENQLLTLTKNQVLAGDEVWVSYLKGKADLAQQFESNGVKVDHALAGEKFLKQIFKKRKVKIYPDILHLHLARSEVVFGFFPLKYPRVVTRHNSEIFFPKFRLLSKFLSRLVTNDTVSIIAISKSVRDFLIKKKEISNYKKIKTIYYGYDRKIPVKKFKNNFPKQLPKTLTIGTISRLVDQKDVATIIKSIYLLQKSNLRCSLEIIGEGNKKLELQKLAKSLGISSNITFHSKVNNPWKVAKNWDIFCLASLYEGFGLVLLEAMDYSIPIVASKISTSCEILGKRYPYFFEPGNELHLAQNLREIRNLDYDFKLNFNSALKNYDSHLQMSLHSNLYNKVVLKTS